MQKDVAEVRAERLAALRLDLAARRAAAADPTSPISAIPLAEMCNAAFKGVRERILMKNIAYAGALAALLDIDTDVIRALLNEKYGAKQALMDSNQKAVDLGYDYATEHFSCPLPIHLEKMDATKDSHPDRRQHRRRRSARSTPARRSAPGIRSRRRRR